MEQEYLQELFSFQAELQFFNDAGLFEMEPAEEGTKALSSYGLYFKPTDNGFTVAAPFIGHPDTGLMELKNQFDDGEVYTKYYVEDGKQYAQMILYLVKENYQYVLKPTYEPAGEFTYKIFGDKGDITIQFINNVVVAKVTLHFAIPGKIGRHYCPMHKVRGVYSMEQLIKRMYPYLRITKGDKIDYSFTYELSNGQRAASATYSYEFTD